jgi:hypothetical protein
MNQAQNRELAQAGLAALQRGDRVAARDAFGQLIQSGQADATAFLLFAQCCDDEAERMQAVDAALERDPRNLRALLIKGDHLARIGDPRAAFAYYSAVAKLAPPDLPPEMEREVERARQVAQSYSGQFEAYLAGKTGEGCEASSRFAQSVDMLLGKKRLFVQQPLHYYFPELPQIQFYERESVPFLDGVEQAFGDIRAELTALLQQGDEFQPYVERQRDRPVIREMAGMLENPNWGAFYLWKNGEVVPENAERCPKTLAALEHCPLTRIPGRAPSILFSLLRPRTRIPPHNGFINARLICHLPLIVPENCGLRVGNDSRAVVEGQAWAFDDSIEHEAWNDSDQPRVILLFEVWRPELTETERRSVGSMFEAIDAYGAGPRWQV